MDEESLIRIARETLNPMDLGNGFSSGGVGAAMESESGRIYTGVCFDLASGLGFCAEVAAVAEMLKSGESRILRVVAVDWDGSVMPPCGRCRETMLQVNAANRDTTVLLPAGRRARLVDLLPDHWL
jgi:cytidine deaminase